MSARTLTDDQQVGATCSGWYGELCLGFSKDENRTSLTYSRHRGPLVIQRPFYPEGSPCHLYLLHPPGGVVGGDELKIDIDCHRNAEVLLTTPAAGKFYRSDGRIAKQSIAIRLEDDATLEWLPQETIFFQGALVETANRITLGQNSRFIGWDVFCLGRPAAGEAFDTGKIVADFELWRKGKPLLLERMILDTSVLNANWGMQALPVFGIMLASPVEHRDLCAVREMVKSYSHVGVTLIDDVLICRMLGGQAMLVREVFFGIWEIIRPVVCGRTVCAPRIWST